MAEMEIISQGGSSQKDADPLHLSSPGGQATEGNEQVTGGNEQATGGNEQATGGNEQATGGNEQATGGNEPATGRNEQATGGNEQATGGNEQATGGNEPATGGNEQATGGNEQATGGNEPATGGNEPATGGNEQATGGNEQATGGNEQATGGNEQTTKDFEETRRKLPLSMADWTEDDVRYWLKQNGLPTDVANKFYEECVSGEVLQGYTDDELSKDFHDLRKGHLRLILRRRDSLLEMSSKKLEETNKEYRNIISSNLKDQGIFIKGPLTADAGNEQRQEAVTSEKSSAEKEVITGQSEDNASSQQEPQWVQLEAALGFNEATRTSIHKAYTIDNTQSVYYMLGYWKRMLSSKGNDMNDLVCRALIKIGKEDLAEKLQGLGNQDFCKLAANLGDEWVSLATHLGLTLADIQHIKQNVPCDVKRQILLMLIQWKQRQNPNEDLNTMLCKALKEEGRADLAGQVQRGVCTLANTQNVQLVNDNLHKMALILMGKDKYESVNSNIYCVSKTDLQSLKSQLQSSTNVLDVNLLRLFCTSFEQMELVSGIIQNGNLKTSHLFVHIDMCEQLKEVLELLEHSFESMNEVPVVSLSFHWKDFYGHCDIGYVMGCFARIGMSSKLKYLNIDFVPSKRIQSRSDVISMVNKLKGCKKLYGFKLSYTNMHGHVSLLSLLVTLNVKSLNLIDCQLVDDDIRDLISILPAGYGLCTLCLSFNSFSVDTLKTLTNHLMHLPNLFELDLRDIGVPASLVRQVIKECLPQLTESTKGIFRK